MNTCRILHEFGESSHRLSDVGTSSNQKVHERSNSHSERDILHVIDFGRSSWALIRGKLCTRVHRRRSRFGVLHVETGKDQLDVVGLVKGNCLHLTISGDFDAKKPVEFALIRELEVSLQPLLHLHIFLQTRSHCGHQGNHPYQIGTTGTYGDI